MHNTRVIINVISSTCVWQVNMFVVRKMSGNVAAVKKFMFWTVFLQISVFYIHVCCDPAHASRARCQYPGFVCRRLNCNWIKGVWYLKSMAQQKKKRHEGRNVHCWIFYYTVERTKKWRCWIKAWRHTQSPLCVHPVWEKNTIYSIHHTLNMEIDASTEP